MWLILELWLLVELLLFLYFVKKISDTVAHVGLTSTQTIALTANKTFSFSFRSGSIDKTVAGLDKKEVYTTASDLKHSVTRDKGFVSLASKVGTVPAPPLAAPSGIVVFGESSNNVTVSAGGNLTISVSFTVPSTVTDPTYAKMFISSKGATSGSTYKEITKTLARDSGKIVLVQKQVVQQRLLL